MSYGLAIHTESETFPLRKGRRSFEIIQDKRGFIHFRVPLGKDEYVTEYSQGGFKLGKDFDSLIREAVGNKTPFAFCYFLLPHNDSDEDIISLFESKTTALPEDRKVSVGVPYRMV